MTYFKLKLRYYLVSAIALVMLSGCGIFESESSDVLDSLEVQLNLEKNEIASGESSLAMYSVKNSSNQKLEIVTSCPNFAGGVVFQNSERVDLHGISNFCPSILGGFSIEPEQSLNFEWEIHAFTLKNNNNNSSIDTTFVAQGDYVLSIFTNVIRINGEDATVDPVESTFSIK